MTAVFFCGALLWVGQASASEPVSETVSTTKAAPPLSADQIAKIRTLLQSVRTEQSKLQEQLSKHQTQLAECYGNYELDEEQIQSLQGKILKHQKSLLASHHRLHTELRRLVGPERFRTLHRRIENALKSTPDRKQKTPR